tara:strand:+ start:4731 stop:5543 length:813 start_codon:yes stop_codon:yes gene_type:complete
MNVTFIGGGNMASALIGGLLQQGFSTTQICVVEISSTARKRIKNKYNVTVTEKLTDGIVNCNIILLAVKPQQVPSVAQDLAPLLKTHLIISVVAGIRAKEICNWLYGYKKIIRAMPNTPAFVRAAITGLFALPKINTVEKHYAETIIKAVGTILWVEKEEQLDAVTAISGSGPAYIFYFMEAMEKAGRELGLNETQAHQLSLETFLGATKLASISKETPTVLRSNVTSKNGTTERAINAMKNSGIDKKIIHAIHLAHKRSQDIGDEFSTK